MANLDQLVPNILKAVDALRDEVNSAKGLSVIKARERAVQVLSQYGGGFPSFSSLSKERQEELYRKKGPGGAAPYYYSLGMPRDTKGRFMKRTKRIRYPR